MPVVPVDAAGGGAGGAAGGAAPGDAPGEADEGEALAQAVRATNPTLGYLMPDFQNPTGRSLTASARERLVDAAARQGTVLIADETTAELDIDRPGGPYPPLAAFGPAVLVGSLGKLAWGGVRIGWIRADPALIARLVAARSPGDLGTPVFEQLLAVQLLERHDDAVALRRTRLAAGRALVEELLAASFPSWRVPHVDGGIATWVHLGAPVSSQLALAARARGLLIAAGPRFGVDGAFERHLRMPICQSEDETREAVRLLELAWASLGDVGAVEPGFAALV
ncbi:aminotransferase class I/II-fold pyridoxal phosphate-dependent enzyme [Agromyces archimandritae]|uniref:aminotransferase class I/II-fold pyridoxal phosphate-dependent enzyme n=1 Tax=Agromyces archimandritae TaxID=2781962 RepID=UPI001FD57E19|nr:aminotransferase class I/II-fold pyridoxal phosphate-dependent enzyme [Agromyces archimandritae]